MDNPFKVLIDHKDLKNKALEDMRSLGRQLWNKETYFNKQSSLKVLDCEDVIYSDMVLYRIKSITFQEDAPRREALENVLSALRIEGINFVYLVLGDHESVSFYYGIARDYSKNAPDLDIDDIGKFILEPSIRGNFRGSDIALVKREEKERILDHIRRGRYSSMIEGVPGILQDENGEFQGVDRLANVMMADSSFGFMIIASLMNDEEIKVVENHIFDIYSKQPSLSIQTSFSDGVSTSEQTSKSHNESLTQGVSQSASESTSKSMSGTTTNTESEDEGRSQQKSKSETKGTQTSKSSSTTKSSGSSSSSTSTSTDQSGSESSNTSDTNTDTTSKSKNKSHSQANSESKSTSTSTNKSTDESKSKGKDESQSHTQSTEKSHSASASMECADKQTQDWLKYIDEILLPRIDYGKGKGMFVSGMYCFASSKAVLKKLENTVISLFSGENGNKVPLKAFMLQEGSPLSKAFKNLQLGRMQNAHDAKMGALYSQNYPYVGNWISTKELSLIAGLPKQEIMGLELLEEVEFGLNYEAPCDNDALELGKLVQSGHVTHQKVSIKKSDLDKHIFISGVTGSGKTTTCHNILQNAHLPFLVIEPAKTEYRILKNQYPDLLIFTLGKDDIAPFRLNPFEFFPHENITSRVDMIKGSIEAAFDMEAAIPQIIESAIYECYKDKGWNIATNKNEYYDDPFAGGVYAFPTLSDVYHKVDAVVKKQGFSDRLKDEYIGSIKARLNGLLVGAKGFMLDTPRSINFRDLLSRKVVLEIEEIRNGSEKSLVMGFVIGHLLEAIKAEFFATKKHGIKHIILIEEAHRLLSRYEPGDSHNKKQGVEMFADMLAEIRKYGECLIIADQIPNKLTPEVLKNTNTKIVHRLFAQDDKNAIASTMALEKDQSEFLSRLETGRAIVFSGGFHKALSVQINKGSDTTGDDWIEENKLSEAVFDFYAQHAKDGVIVGSDVLEGVDVHKIKDLLEFGKNAGEWFEKIMKNYVGQEHKKINKELSEKLRHIDYPDELLAKYLCLKGHVKPSSKDQALEFIKFYKAGIDDETRFVGFNDSGLFDG